jgi:hypothetical protein
MTIFPIAASRMPGLTNLRRIVTPFAKRMSSGVHVLGAWRCGTGLEVAKESIALWSLRLPVEGTVLGHRPSAGKFLERFSRAREIIFRARYLAPEDAD